MQFFHMRGSFCHKSHGPRATTGLMPSGEHTSWAVNCRWKVCCRSSMELGRLTPPGAGRAARICCGAATSTPTMHTGSDASTT